MPKSEHSKTVSLPDGDIEITIADTDSIRVAKRISDPQGRIVTLKNTRIKPMTHEDLDMWNKNWDN